MYLYNPFNEKGRVVCEAIGNRRKHDIEQINIG
jgi:hypothetical protein